MPVHANGGALGELFVRQFIALNYQCVSRNLDICALAQKHVNNPIVVVRHFSDWRNECVCGDRNVRGSRAWIVTNIRQVGSGVHRPTDFSQTLMLIFPLLSVCSNVVQCHLFSCWCFSKLHYTGSLLVLFSVESIDLVTCSRDVYTKWCILWPK